MALEALQVWHLCLGVLLTPKYFLMRFFTLFLRRSGMFVVEGVMDGKVGSRSMLLVGREGTYGLHGLNSFACCTQTFHGSLNFRVILLRR